MHRELRIDARVLQTAVPSEVLDEIVACLLAGKHAFSSIANFSLVSYQFRRTALRRFFARLYVRSPSHWIHCCQIMGIFSWARFLECSSKTISIQTENLIEYYNLQAVEIDFSPDGLSTQTNRIQLIFQHLPTRLTCLTLTFLPRIDTSLLSLISTNFPALETLELTCTERLDETCCWLCYEESFSRTLHSPIPEYYSTVEDLAVAFATAIKPLRKLQHLVLGVFLSDVALPDNHVAHHHLYNPFDPLQGGADLPYGPDCCIFCADQDVEVRRREMVASATVAIIVESLETVTWSTYFAKNEPGDDEQTRETTAWVRRRDGKVHVRRTPW
ncbi:hypothetical protein BKA93DRAFT_732830 [Sparassis latifolia]